VLFCASSGISAQIPEVPFFFAPAHRLFYFFFLIPWYLVCNFQYRISAGEREGWMFSLVFMLLLLHLLPLSSITPFQMEYC